MSLSLAQLQAFAELANCGSFSKAARRLGLTQPAITQHVSNLARHFRVPLVDVVHRRPVLTEAGRYLAERAAAVMRSLNSIDQEMGEFADVRTGVLRIGATQTIGTYLLPAFLARYARERPEIRPEIRIGNTAAISGMIRAGEIGLALIEGAVAPDLVGTPFEHDELVLVTTACDKRFKGCQFVEAQQLAEVSFVSRESGSGTRDFGYEALRRMGIEPPIAVVLPSGEAILQAVLAGLGVAILSRFVLQGHAHDIHTLRIKDLPMQRSLCVVAAPHRSLSPAQHAFAELVLPSSSPADLFKNRPAPAG